MGGLATLWLGMRRCVASLIPPNIVARNLGRVYRSPLHAEAWQFCSQLPSWKRSRGTAPFRSRCKGSTWVVNAKEIGDLDRGGAALGEIADPPSTRIRSSSSC